MIPPNEETDTHHASVLPEKLEQAAAPAATFQNYHAVSEIEPDESTITTTTVTTTTTAKTVGRLLLFLVAFLYGSLNVTLRKVYSMEGPPTPSALSAVRGWLAVICFAPFLVLNNNNNNNKDNKEKRHSTPEETITTTTTTTSAIETAEQSLPLIQQQQAQQSTTTTTTTITSTTTRPLWSIALELGGWNFAAQGMINAGLIYTTGARAAFLTQTSVIITPIITVIAGQRPRYTVWFGVASALVGLVFLSSNDSSGDGSDGSGKMDVGGNLGFGDVLVLAGSACWSMYLFRLSSCGGDYNEVHLQGMKTVYMACFYSVWYIVAQSQSTTGLLWPGWTDWAQWGFLLYSAFGPGSLADVLQTVGQTSVSADEANVILSMEPVFTSILGFAFLGEAVKHMEKIGGAFLVLAAILATR